MVRTHKLLDEVNDLAKQINTVLEKKEAETWRLGYWRGFVTPFKSLTSPF